VESLPNYPVEAAAATSTCVVSIDRHNARVVTMDDVRRLALSLPRTYERLIGDSVRFKVGQLVYASISADETLMGFGFPREERTALIASDPEKFLMPVRSDERYNWVRVRLAAIDEAEMTELVIDAWRMVVPKGVAAAHLGE
jgi:hypothetical protein